MLHICIKFCESISKSFKVQTQTVGLRLGWSQFTKGHYSNKTIGEHTVIVLSTLFDDVFYLYQVHENISEGFRDLERSRTAY